MPCMKRRGCFPSFFIPVRQGPAFLPDDKRNPRAQKPEVREGSGERSAPGPACRQKTHTPRARISGKGAGKGQRTASFFSDAGHRLRTGEPLPAASPSLPTKRLPLTRTGPGFYQHPTAGEARHCFYCVCTTTGAQGACFQRRASCPPQAKGGPSALHARVRLLCRRTLPAKRSPHKTGAFLFRSLPRPHLPDGLTKEGSPKTASLYS